MSGGRTGIPHTLGSVSIGATADAVESGGEPVAQQTGGQHPVGDPVVDQTLDENQCLECREAAAGERTGAGDRGVPAVDH